MIPRKNYHLTALCLGFSVLLLASCGGADDEAEEPDTGPEVTEAPDTGPQETNGPPPINEAGSFYSLEIITPSGLLQTFERQIDEAPYVVAFGSSHIAPAVSLAIEDTFYKPYATVTFNFGFVVGSNDYAVTIEEEGKWTWGKGEKNAPPGFKITMKDNNIQKTFVSWHAKSEGDFLITKWGKNEGTIVEGKIEGTLINEGDPNADAPETATVSGKFHFILPDPGQ